jgi:hypothetical protein
MISRDPNEFGEARPQGIEDKLDVIQVFPEISTDDQPIVGTGRHGFELATILGKTHV